MTLTTIKAITLPVFVITAGYFSLPAVLTSSPEPVMRAAESASNQKDQQLLKLSKDPVTVAEGKEYYTAYCLACHGPEGLEIDSPSNLFDDKWYQRSGPSGIEESIRKGVLEKGMPAWGEMIPDDQILSLIAYLLSFQTTATTTT